MVLHAYTGQVEFGSQRIPVLRSMCLCLLQLMFCLQIDALKQQPQLVVATPGRLLDLIDDDECFLTLGRQFAQVLNIVPCQSGKHVLYDKYTT